MFTIIVLLIIIICILLFGSLAVKNAIGSIFSGLCLVVASIVMIVFYRDLIVFKYFLATIFIAAVI